MACLINNYRLIILKKLQKCASVRNPQFILNITQCKHIETFSMCLATCSDKPFSLLGCNSTKTSLTQLVEQKQNFSTTACILVKRKPAIVTETAKTDVPRKNTPVQVFDMTDKLIGKMTLAKAEELAKKDELKLVDIGRNVDRISCFKLMTGKQLFEEDMKQKTVKKHEATKKDKEFRIKIKISDHDLEIKLNQIKVTLQKGMNVKIVVRADRRTEEVKKYFHLFSTCYSNF